MEINKIIILGIDALEYDLVEEWDLKNLKQKEYGKTELPIKEDDGHYYPGPNTVLIWPSFITGMPPKKHGIGSVRIYPFNFLYKSYLKRIYGERSRITSMHKKTLFRIMMDKLSGFIFRLELSRTPTRDDIKCSTIFDLPNSIHFHIPVYDEISPNRGKTLKAIEDKEYRPIFEILMKKEFNQRTKEVLEEIDNNNWKIFMEYFSALDGIQHVFFNNPKKIAKFYLMFDEFLGKVKQKIDDNTFLLIVSDHGQKKGIHTDYGFYSINKPLELKNPKLIDFRWIIERLLKE